MTHDEQVLRKLVQEYKEYAFTEKNEKKKVLQTAVNDLKQIRPIILIDELPFHELNQNHELDLLCEDPFLRGVERELREYLYRYRHIPGDMHLPQRINVGKVIHTTGKGIEVKQDVLEVAENSNVSAHKYYDVLEDESVLEKIHNETITYDEKESLRRFELVSNMVGDIMPVRLVGDQWCFDTLWDDVAQLHGVGNLLIDLLDREDFMHALAAKLTDVFLDKVRQYEELNLFWGDQESLHQTAAYTSDLPARDFDGVHYKAKDVWGRGAAQVFVSVSPEMRKEFDLPYMAKAMEPFGLVYYGCCEPLHNQIDALKVIPHLRKITVTPWAKYDVCAEQIGKDYVYSAKAQPANVAMSTFSEEAVRAELKMITDAAYKNGCNFELVLKDVSTVSKHPENLEKWLKIAREFIPED